MAFWVGALLGVAGAVVLGVPLLPGGVGFSENLPHGVVGVTGGVAHRVGGALDVAVAVKAAALGAGLAGVFAAGALAEGLAVVVVGPGAGALFGFALGFYLFNKVAFAVVFPYGDVACGVYVLGLGIKLAVVGGALARAVRVGDSKLVFVAVVVVKFFWTGLKRPWLKKLFFLLNGC